MRGAHYSATRPTIIASEPSNATIEWSPEFKPAPTNTQWRTTQLAESFQLAAEFTQSTQFTG